jgi:hypothetical protein
LETFHAKTGLTLVKIVSGLEDDGRQQNEEERGRREVLDLLQLRRRQQLDRQPDRAAQEHDGWNRDINVII